MTYRELLNYLRRISREDAARLDDHVAVITSHTDPTDPKPLFVTHVERNDGSIRHGVERYQILLMTI